MQPEDQCPEGLHPEEAVMNHPVCIHGDTPYADIITEAWFDRAYNCVSVEDAIEVAAYLRNVYDLDEETAKIASTVSALAMFRGWAVQYGLGRADQMLEATVLFDALMLDRETASSGEPTFRHIHLGLLTDPGHVEDIRTFSPLVKRWAMARAEDKIRRFRDVMKPDAREYLEKVAKGEFPDWIRFEGDE